MIMFGHSLRYRITIAFSSSIFHNMNVAPVWWETWEARAEALRLRCGKQAEATRPHMCTLPTLLSFSRVRLQNLHDPTPLKWDRTGSVIKVLSHDQYLVLMAVWPGTTDITLDWASPWRTAIAINASTLLLGRGTCTGQLATYSFCLLSTNLTTMSLFAATHSAGST